MFPQIFEEKYIKKYIFWIILPSEPIEFDIIEREARVYCVLAKLNLFLSER